MNKKLYPEIYREKEYYWWHLGRRELTLLLLKQNFNFKKNQKYAFLDMGCGTGKMMDVLSSFGKVSGLDFSNEALDFCRKRGHKSLYKVDLSSDKIPFDDNYFDAAFSLDVLEHIKREDNYLAEAFRVLKENGTLIIIVPAYQFLWSYWDKLAGHQRRYNQKYLSLKLLKNHFYITKLSYFYSFALPTAMIYRFVKGIFIGKSDKYSSDFVNVPIVLNKLFLFLSKIERRFIAKSNFPFGLSLICIAQKR